MVPFWLLVLVDLVVTVGSCILVVDSGAASILVESDTSVLKNIHCG
jgi:hypothetical protein